MSCNSMRSLRLYVCQCSILLLYLLTTLCGVCCTEDNYTLFSTYTSESGNGKDWHERTSLRILSIGNSYAVDALLYVPYIMNDILPELDLTVAIVGSSARSLEEHYGLNMINSNTYDYYYKNSNCGKWISYGRNNIEYILRHDKWDLILLQQASQLSFDYQSYSYASLMIDWIESHSSYSLNYGWILTPAYPDGSTRLPGPNSAGIATGYNTSDEMYVGITQCVSHLKKDESRLSIICPVGTAIQNARHSSLDVYGRAKHLSYDGIHLQDGIGRMVAALTVCQSLIEFYNLKANIEDCRLLISNDFCSAYCAIQNRGDVVGISEVNLMRAIQCSLAACSNPFSVSNQNVGD